VPINGEVIRTAWCATQSAYEFDNAGKIRHLDIYLQMHLPDLEMLKSYEGITIAQ
jgi:hypothetical protein